METAYKRATEGGYKGYVEAWAGEIMHDARCITLLDPEFWKCLGKTEGWLDIHRNPHLARNKEPQEEYMFRWHSMLDHLAEGKDVDSFFNGILK